MIKDIKICMSCNDFEDCKKRFKVVRDKTQIIEKNEKQLTYCSNMGE